MKIDLSRDALFTPFGLATVKKSYLIEGETSPQQAFARVAQAFGDDRAHAQRLYDYLSKMWFMASTPVLSNGGTRRGMPISCFLNYVPDSRIGILEHYQETGMLASIGGGVGGYWGELRPDGSRTANGSRSNGTIPFLKVMDDLMPAFNQGDTRRGSYAAFQHVNHSEIEEFIDIRNPNGDHFRRCLGTGFHHGVILSDAFMEAVEAGRDWDLIDPHTQAVTKTVKARHLWQQILQTRAKTGEPYLIFADTANRYMNPTLKKLGLKIWQSNLCTEIFLPTGPDQFGNMRTAVCCLSSVNLAKYDEWADVADQFIGDLIRMLDNVLDHFIRYAPAEAANAVYAASRSRDLGLGAMGFHTYLQAHSVPFESDQAKEINTAMFRMINRHAVAASRQLAVERGEAPDLLGTGMRNGHLLAVAPNASSSVICMEVSPSIEPIRSNAYKRTTQNGVSLVKNPQLEKVLESYGHNDAETWRSIVEHEGSVQHLDFLSDHDRMVFRTAFELDQHWLVEHAALRQPWICQGQSLNLYFLSNAPAKYLHQVHIAAWKKGLKSVYYYRTKTSQRAEHVGAVQTRQTIQAPALDPEQVSCPSCEG